MSLGIYVLDRRGREITHISADREESFRLLCQAGPWESLRRGVMTHGETTFNRIQLMRLVELSKVAMTESSYLHLTGG
ncbi:hypothetical protein ACFWP5_45630 [Streptomyces sp. NPDC058469]|uniref:hypothetical protein n=1 Tax=Streptomyces sp. NPDC058469 TaxID=3346514 RepID=UPI00364B901A